MILSSDSTLSPAGLVGAPRSRIRNMICASGNIDAIGDGLNAVTFYLSIAAEHNSFVADQGGFCSVVRPLLRGLPIRFRCVSDRFAG
jgi:hypothetical protein